MRLKNEHPTLNIGSWQLSAHSPAFIIAEVGINHNGSLDRAKFLIESAKEAGASAVKFQKRSLTDIYTEAVLQKLDNFEQGFQYLIPILKEFEFTPDQMWELKEFCDEIDLIFLCTPFDIESAELLEQFNVEAYKISSADLTNTLLLEKVLEWKKPLLLSTGMSEEHEIERTVGLLKKCEATFALMHCVSSYPVDPRDARLRRISELQDLYECPVGYSGHDIGISLSIAARTLGACVIEKHFTTDRELRGPDHKVSLLPDELKNLVDSVRECEQALFDQKTQLLPVEALNQMIFRKSLVAAVPIRKGDIISRDKVAAKSPGNGLGVQELDALVGKTSVRNLEVDDVFLPTDIGMQNGRGAVETFEWGRWGLVVRYHDMELAIPYKPQTLEFHLTYRDTQLPIPHETLKRHAEQLSQTDLRVHCCEYIGEDLFDICNPTKVTRRKARLTLQRVIDITAELAPYFNGKTPMIVFNCGAMTLQRSDRKVTVDVDTFYKEIASLDTKGTLLLAQNMPPNPWYFGGQWKGHYFIRTEELIDFCKTTGHALCLDLSHAYMAAHGIAEEEGRPVNFAEYISVLKPFVRHVHLSDARSCEGEGIQIGEGEIDFREFFELYSDYTGTWVPEIWLGHVNDNYRAKQAISLLRDSYLDASLTPHQNGATNGGATNGFDKNGIGQSGAVHTCSSNGGASSTGSTNSGSSTRYGE